MTFGHMPWLLSGSVKLWIRARRSIVKSCPHLYGNERGGVLLRPYRLWRVMEGSVVCILPCLERSPGPEHVRQAPADVRQAPAGPAGLPGRTCQCLGHVCRGTHTPAWFLSCHACRPWTMSLCGEVELVPGPVPTSAPASCL